jgi:hypothetical protein
MAGTSPAMTKNATLPPATRYARVVDPSFAPRGRGECRVPVAPAALRVKVENTQVSHHGRTGITRHSRTRMVLTFSFVVSPETGFLSPSSSETCSRNLIPASGYQDATTSPSAFACVRLSHGKRPPHPAPNVRDDRETPLCSGARDAGLMDVIWAEREAIYFCGDDWTGSIGLIGFYKFAVWCRGSTLICMAILSPLSLRPNGSCECTPDDRLRASRGPIRRVASFERRRQTAFEQQHSLWLWVPACHLAKASAGPTRDSSFIAPIIAEATRSRSTPTWSTLWPESRPAL